MNVREQKGVKIAHRQVALPQLLPQGLQCRTRTRIDQRAMTFPFKQRRRDGTRVPHPVVVECCDGWHQKSSVAQVHGPVAEARKGKTKRKETVAVKGNCGITLRRRALFLCVDSRAQK